MFTGGLTMVVSIVPIGNSCEIRFPKTILEPFAFKDKMDMDMEVTGIV